MMQNEYTDYNELGQAAGRGTLGAAARWLGFAAMLALAAFTAVHAINLAAYQRAAMPENGDLVTWLQIAGVVLVEIFALATGIMLLTHRIRARQKPAAIAIELSWLIFAAMNLIGSFAVERTGQIPAFVASWITYGLPVSALIIGAEFWILMRLDPDIQRTAAEAELSEHIASVRHSARLEVMSSAQMRQVIRQMAWQQLPPIIGRDLNLTEAQISALVDQAPDLLDQRDPALFGQTATVSANGRPPAEV